MIKKIKNKIKYKLRNKLKYKLLNKLAKLRGSKAWGNFVRIFWGV